ncbi:MAG: efflux RND transporter periplasmic adaptor subunit [Acidobacteriota bacterium]|nr:efflux RND transporter periplasmic adaptor subunit [Acidobacteriota bacterium]
MKAPMICLLIVTPLLYLGCANQASEDVVRNVPDLAERLRYEMVGAAEDRELITLPAQVQAAPSFRFDLSPPVEARLTEVLAREGQWVDVDTPLARLQIPSLTAWRDIEKAAAQHLKAAEKQLAMGQEKLALGMTTGDAVQALAAEVADARLALARIEADRKAVEKSGLRSDSRAEFTFTWNAGRSGVIGAVKAREGQSLTPGKTVFSLVDVSRVEVVVHLPERLLTETGEKPKLSWQPAGLPMETEPFILEFARAGMTVDPVTRTTPWYFAGTPRQKGDPYFLPGRSGRGALLVSAESDTRSLPKQALCRLEGRDGVFLESADPSRPEWVQVEVLGRRGEHVLVRSSQLKTDSRVVVRGVFLLKSIMLLNEES